MTDPPAWLRRAGTGRLDGGGVVVWSVAEGRRGRRWRWTVVDDGIVRHAGLVEQDERGRLGRLELATADGMLTLHPSDDRREIHGNVVAPSGVRGLAFPADGPTELAIEGDAFGTALLGAGEGMCLRIRDGLLVAATRERPPRLQLDDRGIPILVDAAEWSLEE